MAKVCIDSERDVSQSFVPRIAWAMQRLKFFEKFFNILIYSLLLAIYRLFRRLRLLSWLNVRYLST